MKPRNQIAIDLAFLLFFAAIIVALLGMCGVGLGQTWVHVPAIRSASPNLGPTLQAIESRMPLIHGYRDSRKGTWAHETTHGLNARVRNTMYNQGYRRHNCLFVPPSWCAVVHDPTGLTLSSVAAAVPPSWRGTSYSLYMQQMRRWWENEPTYVLDEWTAYTNGTKVVYETRTQPMYSDPLQMTEFLGYSLTLSAISPQNADLHGFVGWYSLYTVRTLDEVAQWTDTGPARRHLQTLRTSTDGARIRAACAARFGAEWKAEVLP